MAPSVDSEEVWTRLQEYVDAAQTISIGAGGDPEQHTAMFLQSISLEKVFECLEGASAEDNEDRVKLISKSLEFIFKSQLVRQQMFHVQFLPILVNGLHHREVHVRILTAKQIKDVGLVNFPEDVSMPLLKAVVEALTDPDTTVGLCATDTILQFSSGKGSRQHLESTLEELGRLVAKLQGSGSDTSTATLRVFHIVATLSARGEDELKLCKSSGSLDPLLDLVGSDDILLQLNALNLIPLVAVTDAGFELLVQSKVIQRLSEMAGVDKEESEPSPFLGDYSLRVMSQLSARALGAENVLKDFDSSEMSLNFLNIISLRIDKCLESRDPTEAASLMLALGFFTGAKPALSIQEIMKYSDSELILKWMRLANYTGEKFQIAGLESLARALRGGSVVSNEAQYFGSDELDKLEAKLAVKMYGEVNIKDRTTAAEFGRELAVEYGKAYSVLRSETEETDTVGILLKLTTVPIDDIKCAAYSVIRMIAGQDAEWGLRSLFAHPDTTRLLFDRSVEMSKAAKEWRFSVLEAVERNPRSAVIGETTMEKVRNFLRQGPFKGPPNQVKRAQPAVQMEVS